MGRCYEHQTEAQGRSIPSGPYTTLTPSSLCLQKAPGQPTTALPHPWKGQDALLCPQLLPCPSSGCATSLKRTHGNAAKTPPPAAPNPKQGSLEATDTIFLLLDPKQ